MKRLYIAVALAGLAAATTAQAAYDWKATITWGSAHDGNGGEFLATPAGGDWTVHGITAPFETFCIEVDENVGIGSTYFAEFNQSAWQGGNGGPSPDPLSRGTVYLYRNFLDGTLAGYGNNQASAGALQAAIWWLEQESYSPPDSVNLNAQALGFLTTAQTALGLGSHAALQANQTTADIIAYKVGVLRLAGNYEGTILKQDMLTPIPEPTTIIAGALLLLPFAASTIRRLRTS